MNVGSDANVLESLAKWEFSLPSWKRLALCCSSMTESGTVRYVKSAKIPNGIGSSNISLTWSPAS